MKTSYGMTVWSLCNFIVTQYTSKCTNCYYRQKTSVCLCVDFDSVKLLFINVYLPHEDSEANLDEFNFQLSIINKNVIEMHRECEIILGGDFDVDFSRN